MSLLRLLLISVSLAIFIILAGTLWLSVDSARYYLDQQLQTQADSAATSLALTLSQPSNQDPVTQELIITALFDSGQFKSIVLKNTQGENQIVSRLNRIEGSGAPAWFDRWLGLSRARGVAQVSNGWNQIGSVHLEADASYAQQSLWRSFTRLVAWVVGAGLVWALFVVFLIRWLRRVLQEEITQHLEHLTDDSKHNMQLPQKSTFAELSEVTHALASARQSVLITQEEQNAKIESLQFELHQDEVTGLANRKYFINELRRALEQTQSGWVFLFRQRDLLEINRSLSRANVDDWLRSMGQQIQQVLSQSSWAQQLSVARLNGSDFVVLARDVDETAMQQLATAIQAELRLQRIQLMSGEFCRWALAQTDYQAGQYLAQVMSRLDQALMRAESAGHEQIECLLSEQTTNNQNYLQESETQWRGIIQTALQHNSFSLDVTYQTRLNQPWHAATLMLQPQHSTESLSAYQFMPVATRLGLSAVCDLRTVELALAWLQSHPNERLIIRVSMTSISQEQFAQQVALCLERVDVTLNARLYIELDVFALMKELIQVQRFSHMLHRYGVQLGVRRVLQMPLALLELHDLHANYVRMHAEDIAMMLQKPAGTALLKALWEISQQTQVLWLVDGDIQTLPVDVQHYLAAK